MKSIQILYSSDSCVNYFEAKRVAVILAASFSSESNFDTAVQLIEYYLDGTYDKTSYSKQELKQLKKEGLADITLLLQGKSAVSETFNKLWSLEEDKIRSLNILVTLARWPEWYLLSESQLKDINDHLSSHLSEINAITYYEDGKRICPYDPNGFIDDNDMIKTMVKQQNSIKEFLKQEGIIAPKVNVWSILTQLEFIRKAIDDPVAFELTESEKGYIASVRYIRRHIKTIVSDMRRIISGDIKYNEFSRSESRSTIQPESVKAFLRSVGWQGRIPNVLANIFHPKFPTLNLRAAQGQMELDQNAEFFDTAAGLGPAMKVRYVYNVAVMIQILLTPIADLFKDADCQMDALEESYTRQMLGLGVFKDAVTDAYCIDATGYSDYLFRGIYKWILETYGFPKDIVDIIMNIFRLPIKVGNKFFPVKFGSMQGCKFLVFIMNHANRLMGIIARRINGSWERRLNAGDDVTSLKFDGEFTEEEVHTEMAVFAYFNCPTNPMKTAWLKKDGYFDFCSKYFCKTQSSVEGISGIPPKLIGKQMLSITSFTEIYRFFDNSFITNHNSLKYIWDKCYDMLKPEFELGLGLPNAIGWEGTLDQKVELAKQYSYLLGGLSEDEVDIEQTVKKAINILEQMLTRYRFRPGRLFITINRMSIINPDFKQTQLFRALGEVERSSSEEIFHAIMALKGAKGGNMITLEELKDIGTLINKLQRCVIDGSPKSLSKSGSTYHRIEASKDIDCFMDLSLPISDINTPRLDSFTNPSNFLQDAFWFSSMTDPEYDDLSNVYNYMHRCEVLSLLAADDRIYMEKYGTHVNYYGIDDDGYIIKLTSQDREDEKFFNRSTKFKHPSQIENQYLAELYDIINGNHEFVKQLLDIKVGLYEDLYDRAALSYADALRRQLERQVARMQEGYQNYQIKTQYDKLCRMQHKAIQRMSKYNR